MIGHRPGGLGCDACGHISCVCSTIRDHAEGCRFRTAVVCPVGIECDHGYDVCPVCDPCTCSSVLPDRKILPVVDGQPLTPTERYVLGRPAPGDGIYVVLW